MQRLVPELQNVSQQRFQAASAVITSSRNENGVNDLNAQSNGQSRYSTFTIRLPSSVSAERASRQDFAAVRAGGISGVGRGE